VDSDIGVVSGKGYPDDGFERPAKRICVGYPSGSGDKENMPQPNGAHPTTATLIPLNLSDGLPIPCSQPRPRPRYNPVSEAASNANNSQAMAVATMQSPAVPL